VLKLKYLITGTGRCATVFMARFLTSLGLPCGHESIFDFRGLDHAISRLEGHNPVDLSYSSQNSFKDGVHKPEPKWIDPATIVAESSYMAAPFLRDEAFNDCKFIHIVRNPIKVVNSFCNFLHYFACDYPTNDYETFIFGQLPELRRSMSNYERAALYYVRWNEMIERLMPGPCLFHKAENNMDDVFEFLGISPCVAYNDREINSYRRPVSPFILDDLPEGAIKKSFIDIGKRYGYKMNSLKYLFV